MHEMETKCKYESRETDGEVAKRVSETGSGV